MRKRSLLSVLVSLSYVSFDATADQIKFADGSLLKGTIGKVSLEERKIWFTSVTGENVFSFDQISSYEFEKDSVPVVLNTNQENATQSSSNTNEQKPAYLNFGSHLVKKHSVDVTFINFVSYTLIEGARASDNLDVTLSGMDFSYSYYFDNNWGAKIGYYFGDGDTVSRGSYEMPMEYVYLLNGEKEMSVSGLRTDILFGHNIRDQGFKIYTGFGFYSEGVRRKYVSGADKKESLSGTSFKFGLGYNWDTAALDFWVNIRGENLEGFEGDGSHQGGLSLGYRF